MYRPDQPEQRPRPPFGPSSPCVAHFTPRGPCPLPHLGHMPPRPNEPFSENLFRFSGPPRGPFVRQVTAIFPRRNGQLGQFMYQRRVKYKNWTEPPEEIIWF
ncbi:hypothetical protein ILYODFUR_011749 [Ilyodon furcidens]|uniref:Uncharacterized protein n=1 Tax=Ilyodon furcidens TaxID=33524 RepID=A0ABV0TTT9_9TELE